MSALPETGNHGVRFFVYIIESPSDRDLFEGRSEQGLLGASLKLSGIHSVARTVIGREMLERALAKDVRRVWRERIRALRARNRPMEIPVVHISVHGDARGIELSDGEQVSWPELGELLAPLNNRVGGRLLLALSSCHGFAARILARDEETCPFFAIVGHEGEPNWSDAAVGFAVFSHLLNKGVTAMEATDAMRRATADPSFHCVSAKRARRAFLQYEALEREIEELFSSDSED
jgi:hypothetical protein